MATRTLLLLSALLLPACGDKDDAPTDDTAGVDLDGDGYPAPLDCDDRDNDVYPGAPEICNGEDDDCDGEVDVGAEGSNIWYLDVDGDGWGGSWSELSCVAREGFVMQSGDCDDDDPTIHPESVWYADADRDGYGDPEQPRVQCEPPTGAVADDTDCDDTNADINPATTWYTDSDGDGYGNPATGRQICVAPARSVLDGTDCDDTDAEARPGATWYLDHDGDGYGDPGFEVVTCERPTGFATNDDDCDDSDPVVNPAATWYLDSDGDGYGDDNAAVTRCQGPSGFVLEGGDCDDNDSGISPGAALACDGSDHDCDGLVDNDDDQDGFADVTCGGDDCDDSDASITPQSGLCAQGADCLEVLNTGQSTGDGVYTIDPDGFGTGEDPLEVWCDMTTDGGGWTLCASLTKGYVPAHMLYNANAYAFQARLNSDRDFVYERDAPARYDSTWNASETLNYGQFCRLLGSSVSQTRVQQKSWNYSNNYGASARNNPYQLTRSGTFTGNLFTLWFTNSTSSRTFTHVSGDRLYVTDNNNGYGGPYTTPNVGWTSSNGSPPYTQSTNAWGNVDGSVRCVGCANNGTGYDSLPYAQTTILNNLSDAFWSGIPNLPWGWSDCAANGSCTYHESGFGVWLFWAR